MRCHLNRLHLLAEELGAHDRICGVIRIARAPGIDLGRCAGWVARGRRGQRSELEPAANDRVRSSRRVDPRAMLARITKRAEQADATLVQVLRVGQPALESHLRGYTVGRAAGGKRGLLLESE